MNSRIEKVYKENLEILNSLIGFELQSAIEEQYFFEGKLDEESRGTLKLEFSNKQEFTFNCDSDANSLRINRGGFSTKRTLETDFEDGRYKWKEKEFETKLKLKSLGKIESTEIQISNWYKTKAQIGCRINFENGDFLHIWTIESDNILFGLNEEPNFIEEIKEKLKMIKVNGA